jgi:hypothetical protein
MADFMDQLKALANAVRIRCELAQHIHDTRMSLRTQTPDVQVRAGRISDLSGAETETLAHGGYAECRLHSPTRAH